MIESKGPLCLTSQHGKERALRRPFGWGLGQTLVVCACDTDQLGTFSGEIERYGDALETCRRKAYLGLAQSGLRHGLASEGSFGPHPAVPLLACGQELLLYIDPEHGVEVVEQRLELRTNYSQLQVGPDDDIAGWLRQVGFPSHGVIARPASWRLGDPLWKGLTSATALSAAMAACRAADADGRIQLETDMRAHRNPTRMASIARLGVALVRRLRTPCPNCGLPGWGLQEQRSGLPCSWCGEPTALCLEEIWGCPHCGESRSQARRDGLAAADPAHCSWCNP
jgi:hypothetical protein